MISPNKKINLLVTVVILVSVLGLASCQTTDRGSDAILKVIVYGKVDSLDHKNTNNKSVLIIPHKYPCSDSTGQSDAITHYISAGHVLESGTFRFPFNFPPGLPAGKPQCYEALVVSYDISKEPSPLEYDSLLAGPKKLGADFASHFRVKPPFDSVRVDFTVHDSTKRARKDSIKK